MPWSRSPKLPSKDNISKYVDEKRGGGRKRRLWVPTCLRVNLLLLRSCPGHKRLRFLDYWCWECARMLLSSIFASISSKFTVKWTWMRGSLRTGRTSGSIRGRPGGGRKSSLRGRNIFKFEESFSSFRIRIHIPGLKSEGDLVGLFENVRGESRGMNWFSLGDKDYSRNCLREFIKDSESLNCFALKSILLCIKSPVLY